MARHLAGTDKITSAALGSIPTEGEMYWTAWFKPDQAPGSSAAAPDVMRYRDLTTIGAMGYTWDTSVAAQTHSAYFVTAGGVVHKSQSTVAPVAGAWTQIGGVFTTTGIAPNSQSAIVNGTRSATIASLGAANTPGPSPVFILQGGQNGAAVAELAVWINAASAGNNKLNAFQDSALSRQNCIPPVVVNNSGTNKPTLILYWPLIGYSPEPDLSGNRLNGTIVGTTIVPHPTSWGRTILDPV